MTQLFIRIFVFSIFIYAFLVFINIFKIGYIIITKKALGHIKYIFLPFAKLVNKRPFTILFLYLFHLLLLITPITTPGHIILIEESFLEIKLISFPDNIIDIFTCCIIFSCFVLILKNCFDKQKTKYFIFKEIILITIIVNFISGYIMANTSLFINSIFDLHIISAIFTMIILILLHIDIEIIDKKVHWMYFMFNIMSFRGNKSIQY